MRLSIEEWDKRYHEGKIPWELNAPRDIVKTLFQSYGQQGCTVLDIGCGTGTHAFWLAEQGYAVTACDISAEAIKQAKAQQLITKTAIDFQVLNILDCPSLNQQFAIVFSCAVLNQMQEIVERNKFIENVAALCQDDAYWIDITPSADHAEAITKKTGAPAPPYLTASQIINSVEPYFEVIEMQRTPFPIVREETGQTNFHAWSHVFKKR